MRRGRQLKIAGSVVGAGLCVAGLVLVLTSRGGAAHPHPPGAPQQRYLGSVRAQILLDKDLSGRLTDAELVADGEKACALGAGGGPVSFPDLGGATAVMPPQHAPDSTVQAFAAGGSLADDESQAAIVVVASARHDLCP